VGRGADHQSDQTGCARLYPLLTYTEAYRLIPSTTEVVAGGELTVSWRAQAGSRADWIGLFRVGAANEDYGWWIYTGGGPAGIFELTAPAEAGKYEFRYLLDDDYFDTVRSAPVTVTPGAVPGGAR
jgi:hypothetical protein